MCKLIVNKINHCEGFTTIDNTLLSDKNTSLKAKGLLCFILSLSPNWDFSREGLVACLKEGRDAINSIFKELETNGYLKVYKSRKNGEFFSSYEFYEIPFNQYLALPEKSRRKIHYGEANTENHTQINTKKINIKKKNNKIINRVDSKIITDIKTKINYNMLLKKHKEYDVNKIVKVIAEVITSDEEDESTKCIFNSLNSYHIEYVLEKAKSNSKNIKNYSAWAKKVMSNIPPEETFRIRETDWSTHVESEDGW